MALKILIADPDVEWLSKAKEFFTNALYNVELSQSGKDAQLKIYNSDKLFAALINYDLQNHSGAQVVNFINRNYPGLKVIFIFDTPERRTSEEVTESLSHLKYAATYDKTQDFDELNSFLETHYSVADMLAATPKADKVSEEVEIQLEDSQFTSVPIDAFYSSKAVLFDVFVKLSSGRYVKILHAGDSFSKERIDKYKNEKDVKDLHFYKKDASKYVKFSNYLAEQLVESKKVATHTKMNLLKNVSEKFIENAFAEGIKPQIVEQGREICANVYKMIESSKDLGRMLRDYNEFDPNAFSHSYAVTMFASMIIGQFEWQSKTTIEMTALACMFHDIGKMKLPKDLLHKPESDLSDEEMALLRTHPEVGAALLSNERSVPNAVRQIIMQHHERFDGSGYPLGLKGQKILTLANIVGLADTFYYCVINSPEKKPLPALRAFLTDPNKVRQFNSLIVENFIKSFVDADKLPNKKVS